MPKPNQTIHPTTSIPANPQKYRNRPELSPYERM
jgi:hypothetical protein